METMNGLSNWKLTVRREGDHAAILRAVTCDTRAVLPDEIFGLPVTVLGDHALAPGASQVEGEEVRIVCGREGDWDNRNLQELTLPAGLTEVQNYALYGCRSLHTLHLHDRVDRWGGGCLMNCRLLRSIRLTRVGERQGEALAFLCGELQEELDVHLYGTDGCYTPLVFPGFTEDYEENCPNHHFDYTIRGGGHAYHHTFPDKQLSLRTYDELWDKYLRKGHEPDTAMRLAYTRLRWPTELSAAAEMQYGDYLKKNAEAVLLWQICRRDAQGLSLLLGLLEIDDTLLHRACEQARREGNTEALALLLEKQRKAEPKGFDKDFDL